MTLAAPTPELPVRDVVVAQHHWRDRFGFEVAWHDADGQIGAVALGDGAVFFRETAGSITPVTLWMFADDVDAAYAAMVDRGAEIVDPISDKPWGMRQFTLQDQDGHLIHVHCDL